MDYTPSQIKRMAQIITHRHPLSDAAPASAAISEAKRIYDEMIAPSQTRIARLQAENARLRHKLGVLSDEQP